MLERDFKKRIQNELKKDGWMFIQLVADASVPMGFQDTLVLSPTGYHCFVEWKKSEFAKRQPLQEYWNRKLNEMGHDAFFVYPTNCDEWRAEVLQKSENYGKTIR